MSVDIYVWVFDLCSHFVIFTLGIQKSKYTILMLCLFALLYSLIFDFPPQGMTWFMSENEVQRLDPIQTKKEKVTKG
jgi:hypothetical protein